VNGRLLGAIAIVVGIVVILLSVFAHQLGIGSANFGLKHVAGILVGLVIGAIGVTWVVKG
jgi:hypothetical protein